MTDRRETPCDGRVAHVSLRGKVAADRFVEGVPMQVCAPMADLLAAPDGPRERQLLLGEGFRVLGEPATAGAPPVFGFAERDGYCGYLCPSHLVPAAEATHVVAVRESYLKATPELKHWEPTVPVHLGARVRATDTAGAWTHLDLPRPGGGAAAETWMPTVHLRAAASPAEDPVDVARAFLGTPYLWGGNSGRGIDCSGLVQAAMLACGIACPGDSDQQADRLGVEIGPDVPRRRGDLWFWEGHVGILSDPGTLIHANAWRMAVAEEPLEEAIARIAAAEGKAVSRVRRVTPPAG